MDDCKGYGFPNFNTYIGEIPAFRRNISPPSSGSKVKGKRNQPWEVTGIEQGLLRTAPSGGDVPPKRLAIQD
jgi:hypothetical protein